MGKPVRVHERVSGLCEVCLARNELKNIIARVLTTKVQIHNDDQRM